MMVFLVVAAAVVVKKLADVYVMIDYSNSDQ